ncbi:Kinesin motor domain [Carpediemonas membranifera]|uniref:Kinesin motor domain n=1 Tax=Carpediemonas membranifera TaxID=201153 RepID=A0A8J6AQX8_9EUKA|nr:Kinesin motor domain [Carpediemonas membranifera]|eukprot:KAG9391603.1 Kinesin motor domain [Carpediemonas membranifera]
MQQEIAYVPLALAKQKLMQLEDKHRRALKASRQRERELEAKHEKLTAEIKRLTAALDENRENSVNAPSPELQARSRSLSLEEDSPQVQATLNTSDGAAGDLSTGTNDSSDGEEHTSDELMPSHSDPEDPDETSDEESAADIAESPEPAEDDVPATPTVTVPSETAQAQADAALVAKAAQYKKNEARLQKQLKAAQEELEALKRTQAESAVPADCASAQNPEELDELRRQLEEARAELEQAWAAAEAAKAAVVTVPEVPAQSVAEPAEDGDSDSEAEAVVAPAAAEETSATTPAQPQQVDNSAETARLEAEVEAKTAQLKAVEAELEALKQTHAETTAALESARVEHGKELEALKAELAAAQAAVEEASANEKDDKKAKKAEAKHQAALAKKTTEFEKKEAKLKAELDKTASDVAALKKTHAEDTAALATAKKEHEAEVKKLKAELATTVADAEKQRVEAEKQTSKDAQAAAAANGEAVATLKKETAAVLAERAAEYEQREAGLKAELDSAAAELAALKKTHEDGTAALQQSEEAYTTEIASLKQSLAETIAQSEERVAEEQRKMEETEASLKEAAEKLAAAKEAAIAELKQQGESALAEKTAEIAEKETKYQAELKAASDELLSLKQSHANGAAALEAAKTAHAAETEKLKGQLAEAIEAGEQKLAAEREKMSQSAELLEKAAQREAELEHEMNKLQRTIKKQQKDLEKAETDLHAEQVLRKKYFNQIEDMKGKIRVYCRVRPLSGSEKERGCDNVTNITDEYTIVVKNPQGVSGVQADGNRAYTYDRCFGPDSTQRQVFGETEHIIQSALDGYNCSIFAYGQTGSGKTYTMIGPEDDEHQGIARRAIKRLFELVDRVKAKQQTSFEISCNMMELYNDQLVDLFADESSYTDDGKLKKLDIKKNYSGMVFVANAVEKVAETPQQLFDFMNFGFESRHVASTLMNAESSRSHLVFSIMIRAKNLKTGNTAVGKLSIVDLAGSERVGKSGVSGDQLREAMNINQSLSSLGAVISALTKGEAHIPYRNNKLTMLMSDSIGGNAKTLMFVNISPADYNSEETHISLAYASRVKQIKNIAEKNVETREVKFLRSQIVKLRDMLQEAGMLDEAEDSVGKLHTDISDGYVSKSGTESRRMSMLSPSGRGTPNGVRPHTPGTQPPASTPRNVKGRTLQVPGST